MTTKIRKFNVDDALEYLQAFKDIGDVADLAMVENFLFELKREQQGSLQAPIKPESTDNVQPALRAAPMSVFPTMESLQSVIDLANSQLPVQTPNVMLGLLMSYHNSLLYQVECVKDACKKTI